MEYRITEIKQSGNVRTLPDGWYSGVWSGYRIKITHMMSVYELTTEEGVRGTGSAVVVQVKDGVATFDIVRS